MTQKKKTPAKPLKGAYRSLVVPVDTEKPASTAPVSTTEMDVRVPDALAEQMARLDLSDLEPGAEARRRETAVAETPAQQELVDYFEGRRPYADSLVDVYLSETRSVSSNDMLILRYHHQGNRRLERLIIACIERHPTDKGLLYDLAHLCRFIGQSLPVIDSYCRAIIRENDWPRLRALADDICDHAQLMAPTSRSRFQELLQDHPEKWQLVENTMSKHG